MPREDSVSLVWHIFAQCATNLENRHGETNHHFEGSLSVNCYDDCFDRQSPIKARTTTTILCLSGLPDRSTIILDGSYTLLCLGY